MQFEGSRSAERAGVVIGYVFSYFVFTTALFFILSLTHKLPQSWTYFHIMGITLAVAFIGTGIQRLLR